MSISFSIFISPSPFSSSLLIFSSPSIPDLPLTADDDDDDDDDGDDVDNCRVKSTLRILFPGEDGEVADEIII